MKKLVSILAMASACSEAAAEDAAAVSSPGVLSIRVSGFRSADGQVLVAVFRGGDGFPGDPTRAWKALVTSIVGGRARVDLRDVPPGEYAFSVVHDENGNNTLDTSWIGIPREGFAVSNDARGRLGPPKYRDAKFLVPAGGAVQKVRLVYW